MLLAISVWRRNKEIKLANAITEKKVSIPKQDFQLVQIRRTSSASFVGAPRHIVDYSSPGRFPFLTAFTALLGKRLAYSYFWYILREVINKRNGYFMVRLTIRVKPPPICFLLTTFLITETKIRIEIRENRGPFATIAIGSVWLATNLVIVFKVIIVRWGGVTFHLVIDHAAMNIWICPWGALPILHLTYNNAISH